MNIGNKALLYSPENSAASNNDYAHKMTVYTQGTQGPENSIPEQTFELIHELVEDYPAKFNHEEVVDRAKTLAEYAIKIWP